MLFRSLDTYNGATAAYSLRRLSSSYSGSLIRVRRSSDNAEQDIGFDSNNVLDESALTTFVGAGNNGYIVKWYDQSGNSYDETQSTASAQPQIVNTGSVIKLNSKPCILFDTNKYLYCDLQTIQQPIYYSILTTMPTGVYGFVFDSTHQIGRAHV